MKYLPLLLLLSACASTDSLKPGVERVCVGELCVMRGSAEQIDRHCRKGSANWDDGTPQEAGDGRRARCCVKLKKGRRIRMWITEGEEECFIHEWCHISEFYKADTDHSRCHGFGLGRDIKRLRRD